MITNNIKKVKWVKINGQTYDIVVLCLDATLLQRQTL